MTKPFGQEELLARVRAFLSRSYTPAKPLENKIQVEELLIDLEACRVFIGDQGLHITCTEYALFGVLTHHLDAIVTHDELIAQVWGSETRGQTTTCIPISAVSVRNGGNTPSCSRPCLAWATISTPEKTRSRNVIGFL